MSTPNLMSVGARVAPLLLSCGFACNTVPTDLTGNGNTSGLTVVRTNIKMDDGAGLIGGDDIIVFGTAFNKGVSFMVPSANDNVTRSITNGDRFDSVHFAVAGKKVALLDRNPPTGGALDGAQMTIFDTATGSSTTFPLTDINQTIGGTQNTDGQLQSGGTFIACLNDKDLVSDGNALKVIDVSGATPSIIAFTQYPGTDSTGGLVQFAVDATLSRVVAVSDNLLLVYDITNPTGAPVQFDTGSSANGFNGIDDRFQIVTDNGNVLFRDHTGQFGRATLLNTATGNFTTLSTEDSANGSTMALRGDRYCFFDGGNAAGGRAAIGRVTDAAPTFADENDEISPNTLSHGILGFGLQGAITSDGKFFISGAQVNGIDGHVQVSTGGKFSLLPDPAGDDQFGVLGASINASGSVVTFKTGTDGSTGVFVAFVK